LRAPLAQTHCQVAVVTTRQSVNYCQLARAEDLPIVQRKRMLRIELLKWIRAKNPFVVWFVSDRSPAWYRILGLGGCCDFVRLAVEDCRAVNHSQRFHAKS
jgi:hypothetical protein